VSVGPWAPIRRRRRAGTAAASSGRVRSGTPGLVALLAVAALVVLAACSGDDDDNTPAASSSSAAAPGSTAKPGAPTAPASTTTTRPPLAVPTAGLTVTGEGLFGGAEGTVGLGPQIHAAVLQTLNGYVQQASIGPLSTGQAAQGLDKLFTGPAIRRLSDATRQDRSTITDEGLQPATTKLTIDEETVALTGVADEDGTVGAVAAKLSLKLSVTNDAGSFTVSRKGDLSLIPFAGAWFIDGWNLQVDAAPGLLTNSPTATTTAAGGAGSGSATTASPPATAAPPAPPAAPAAPIGSGS
jgi:hypothetical protein